MNPTLKPNELFVYYKRVDPETVLPASVVVFKNANDSGWGRPGSLVVSRILAGPGDRLAMDGDYYVVNGSRAWRVAAVGERNICIDVPPAPAALVVPDGCYFTVQNTPAQGLDSRVLCWLRKEKIVSSMIWRLGDLNRVK
jgi:signal peptidase I